MIFLLKRANELVTNLSVSRKFLLATLLSSLVTLTAICSISFYREWVFYSEGKEGEARTLSEMLGTNAAAALRFNDPHRAQEYVNSLDHHSDVIHASVFDAEQTLFARFATPEAETAPAYPDFTGVRWDESRLLIARDIVVDGSSLGKSLIAIDTTGYRAAVWRSLWATIALLIGGLAITLLIAARLRKLISGPVNKLLEVTQQVARSKDYSERAAKQHDDEIGSLVESFNSMLEKIEQRDESLRSINANLEKAVRERTEDLSQRNAELEQAMKAAKAASVAKSEFLATTSHELRTPLNPIIGYVEMMLRENPNMEYAKELQLVRQSARQLLELIEDILDFSRIEKGTIEFDDSVFNVLSMCSDVVEIMSAEAHKKGIALDYRHEGIPYQEGDTVAIRGDIGKLRQVLFNLVSNAIKFTDEGHIKVRSELIHSSSNDNLFRIHVSDTGIGIAAENRHKLFKPFSQVDGSLTRRHAGLGLGLAISSRIINAMDGRIDVKSEPGVGSVFTVDFPVELETEEALAKESNQQATQSDADGEAFEGELLIVEDEAVNRELMRAILSSLGYRVTLAVDGIDGLEKTNAHDFDLVFMDISMPRMDGYQAAKEMRQSEGNKRSIPIIAMSAHTTPASIERCKRVGMNDYLPKPISFSTLKATLAKWLEAKKTP